MPVARAWWARDANPSCATSRNSGRMHSLTAACSRLAIPSAMAGRANASLRSSPPRPSPGPPPPRPSCPKSRRSPDARRHAMDWVDLLATYLFALKCVAIVTLLLMLVSGLDDFFIDLVYWSRRAWRHVTIYGHRSPLGYRALYGPIEQP